MSREKLPDYVFGIFPMLHKKLLRRRPESIIPRQQMDVLHKIKFHPDKPMSFYCEKTMVSKPNMTKLVNALIDEGYVTRKRDEEDRRIVTLSPTQAGIDLVDAFFKDLGAQMIESTQVLSDEEIEKLIESFDTIRRIFDKLESVDQDECHGRCKGKEEK